jgi:hypothetical protein
MAAAKLRAENRKAAVGAGAEDKNTGIILNQRARKMLSE